MGFQSVVKDVTNKALPETVSALGDLYNGTDSGQVTVGENAVLKMRYEKLKRKLRN